MCTGGSPKVPTAEPIEPSKPAQASMDAASDSTLRAQMMRRGVYATFSQDRGYGTAADQKSEKLG